MTQFQENLKYVQSKGYENVLRQLAEAEAGEATAAWRGAGDTYETPSKECFEATLAGLRKGIEDAAVYLSAHDIGDSGPHECHFIEALAASMGGR